jgi:hypothetical protein
MMLGDLLHQLGQPQRHVRRRVVAKLLRERRVTRKIGEHRRLGMRDRLPM